MSKSCAIFLVKISEKLPKLVLRKLSILIRHLQSDSYTIRCALIEAIGNLISHHLMSEDTDSAKRQMDSLFDVLEERFRDVNSYVRVKVLQVFGYLCELKAVFLTRRYDLLELILDRLNDKSSHVRRKAIQNLIVFIRTHPFSKDGGELKHSFFVKKLEELTDKLKKFPLLASKDRESNLNLDHRPMEPIRHQDKSTQEMKDQQQVKVNYDGSDFEKANSETSGFFNVQNDYYPMVN